ncbi:hypothetical protein RSAG8_13313, partial [Rhizoctonia solani AG-8 WAC10335]
MAEAKIPYGVYRIRPLSRGRLYLHLDQTNSRISLRPLGEGQEEVDQRWDIAPVESKPNTYTIRHLDRTYALSYADGDPSAYLSVIKDSVEWAIQPRPSGYFSFTVVGKEDLAVKFDIENKDKVPFSTKQPNDANQLWLFEKFREPTPSPERTFATEFFPLTVGEAAKQEYDIIVVGSVVGGGVLVHDIYDTNFRIGPKNSKKVLLLERGGLTFHSHCLNTARPVDLVKDRGQHNDFFFHRFWGDFEIVRCCDKCQDTCNRKGPWECCNGPTGKCCDNCYNKTPDFWSGGPMYNLGGRSAAWGLFIPRIHDRTLREHFPKTIGHELLETYYSKAEYLMNLSLPRSEKIHRHVIDRLNADGLAAVPDSRVQWNWARIASEFQREHNFNFAQGAYSSIDKILEIALGKENEGVGKALADPSVHIALTAKLIMIGTFRSPPLS